jgi:hypothetical protein
LQKKSAIGKMYGYSPYIIGTKLKVYQNNSGNGHGNPKK